MSSSQHTNEDMLEEIPESSVVTHQNQINNDQISDSDESFKTVENFEPVKLNFIRKLAKISGKLDKSELEELVLQKVTESMVYRTKYAEIRVKLDQYEELLQRQKTRIELLEKQYTDLEVTHERILTAMRENPQAPIEPLKIVRSVSCQVYQPTAEIINSIPDPIVIGDSPIKKKRTKRKNVTGKCKKNLNKFTEITIDSDEDEEIGDNIVTRSNGRNQDKSKEKKNSESGSSSIQKDSTSSKNGEQRSRNTSHNEPETAKNLSKSCETQVNFNYSQQTTSKSDLNSSKSSNKKSNDEQAPQKALKNVQNSSNIENKSSKSDQISTSSQNTESSNEATEGNKRGRKRKATTILDMIEKRPKNIPEGSKKTLMENVKNNSKSSKDSDSDNDVTLIEDDIEEPKTKRHQRSNYAELDIELPKVLEKLANISKYRESSKKTSDSKSDSTSKSSITSELNSLISRISETAKQTNLASKSNYSVSSSPEANIESPESASTSSPESIPAQKSFKVPTTKPKAAKTTRPGPKCSKVSNQMELGTSMSQQSSSLLKVSDNLLNGHSNLQNGVQNQRLIQNYPASSTKIHSNPLDSATKFSNLDQSFDSLNSSSSTLDSLSSFKSSANLVTSTPLKAVDHGPFKTVKRTLDMNFNEKPKNDINLSNKVPPLPPRGPQILHPRLKELVPAPTIKVEKVNKGIRISWRIDNFKSSDHADIKAYQIYAFEEMSGKQKISSDDWKLVGDKEIKALLLPMAVMLTEFNEKQKFHFAIRAVDVHKRVGEFSEPKSWD